MTTTEAVIEDASDTSESDGAGPNYSIGKLRYCIARLSPGEQAELRRDPAASLAFYKTQTECFPGIRDDRELDQWVVLVQVVAILFELYDETPLGLALATAGLSEARLTRLLRANGSKLAHEVRSCARFLAAKGVKQNMRGFADLLGLGSTKPAEHIRRRVASDYFLSLATKK